MEKRLEWATKYLDDALNDIFENVIWTDKCNVQAESHRRFSCRKIA